jgi:hypothetical protein
MSSVESETIQIPTVALDGSCTAIAQSYIYGTFDEVLQVNGTQQYLRGIQDAADRKAQGDQDFVAAMSKWQACFKQSGITASDPLEAVDSYYSGDSAPDARELQAAQADVTCKATVGLWDSWQRGLTRAWDSRTDNAQLVLEELIEAQNLALERITSD